jgi:MoxR-like ATPase
MDLLELKDVVEEIYEINFEPFLLGRKDLYYGLLAAYFARGHVLIEGPPGTAKTLIAKLVAKTFSKSFKRIQFTDDLTPKRVIGWHYWHQGKQEFKFNAGPLFSEIILADEINRAPPVTQSAFLEAMEERQLSIEGNTLELGENFFVVATQNPGDYAGTHPLPEVQLDRFIFSFRLQFSSEDEEVMIVQKHLDGLLPPVLTSLRTLDISKDTLTPMLLGVRVDDELIRYAARIVRSTRNNPLFDKGASLRAILALIKGAQVYAALQGREYVVADDIADLAIPAIRHRVTLTEAGKKVGKPIEEHIAEIAQLATSVLKAA